MTEKQMINRLFGNSVYCLWNPLGFMGFPNVQFEPWEADLLVISKSNCVWEVEVKVSRADLKVEFQRGSKKAKHLSLKRKFVDTYNGGHVLRISRFFVAVPNTPDMVSLANEVVPSEYGLIVVNERPDAGHYCRILRKPTQLSKYKIQHEELHKMLISTYHRFWGFRRKEMLDEIKQNIEVLEKEARGA